MAFNRTILNKALPFPADIPMHDIWLGFVGDLLFKTAFLKEQLTFYRKHDNNASNASQIQSNYSIGKRIIFRFNIVKYIIYLMVKK